MTLRSAIVTLATFLVACSSASGPTTPVETIPGPGDYRRTLTAEGFERLYLVHVPPGYDPERPPPVVMAFHGTPGNAELMRRITDLDRLADARGFVTVYPEAAVGDWSTGCLACPSASDHARIDDVDFVRKVFARLSAQLPVDTRRAYAVGFSNGALFTNRLACDAADLFAGSAIIGATLLDDEFTPSCDPARAIPIILIHGDLDPSFPPEGRRFGGRPGAPRTISIDATVEKWASRNGCASPSAPEPLPDTTTDGTRVRVSEWTGCDRGATVRFFEIQGGGHTWPSSPLQFHRSLGPKSLDLDASEAIVRFFLDS